jgi:hypothetical protein
LIRRLWKRWGQRRLGQKLCKRRKIRQPKADAMVE